MRILVVGAGGTGGYYGGRLFEAGRDVSFLVRPARAALLRERGLEIVSPSGDATLHPPLLVADELPSHRAAPFDFVFLSVKAYALEAAIADFAPAVGPETMIVPVLNGMRHIDTLVARFGERAVLGGVSQIAATVDESGRIVHLSPLQKLAYGERAAAVKASGANAAKLEALHTLMTGAVFEARLATDIDQEMWEKWVFLATLGAINCLMRGTIGEVESAQGGAAIARSMLDESAAIATASGSAPGVSFLEATAKMLTAPGSPAHSSMYRDLQRGLRVEVEQILGDLVDRAKSFALQTPLLDAACANLRVYQQRLDAKAQAGEKR